MPFEIPQQPVVRVGRFQKYADAMLAGCKITRAARYKLYEEPPRLFALFGVKPRACALGAMDAGFVAVGGYTPVGSNALDCAYWLRYGSHIFRDNDSGKYTREEIAHRIAALD